MPSDGGKFIFPFVHGSAKLAGEGSEFRTSDGIRQDIEKEKNTAVIFTEKQMNQILQSDNEHKTSWKQNMISGVYQEASFYRDHVQERKYYVCHRKARSPSLTLSGGHTLHWTYHKNVGFMVLGTLKLIGYFQRNGSVSPSSFWKNTPPQGYTWFGRGDEATSRPGHMWPELWSGMSKKAQQKEKTSVGRRKAKTRQ